MSSREETDKSEKDLDGKERGVGIDLEDGKMKTGKRIERRNKRCEWDNIKQIRESMYCEKDRKRNEK